MPEDNTPEILDSGFAVLGNKPLIIAGVALTEGKWKGIDYVADHIAESATRLEGINLTAEHGHLAKWRDKDGKPRKLGKVVWQRYDPELRCLLFKAEVTDDDAIEAINSGEFKAVSPTINLERVPTVNGGIVGKNFQYQDLSLTAKPAQETSYILKTQESLSKAFPPEPESEEPTVKDRLEMLEELLYVHMGVWDVVEDETAEIAPVEELADWDTAYKNDLPNSAFAAIEPDYLNGKTDNKKARHLPHHDKSGSLDLVHLKNAFARVNQLVPITKSISAKALRQKALRALNVHSSKIPHHKEIKLSSTPEGNISGSGTYVYQGSVQNLSTDNSQTKPPASTATAPVQTPVPPANPPQTPPAVTPAPATAPVTPPPQPPATASVQQGPANATVQTPTTGSTVTTPPPAPVVPQPPVTVNVNLPSQAPAPAPTPPPAQVPTPPPAVAPSVPAQPKKTPEQIVKDEKLDAAQLIMYQYGRKKEKEE